MNEFKDPLIPAQRKIKSVIDSFREAPRTEPLIKKIAQGFQERFGLGKYVTHAYVSGEVGKILDVHLGGIDLSKRLPPNVSFIGYRMVGKEDGKNPHEIANDYHHYDSYKKVCGLIVETSPDAQFKLTIGQTRINGLIILHEMGHAWSDIAHPEYRPEKYYYSLSSSVVENLKPEDVSDWFRSIKRRQDQLSGYNDPKIDLNAVVTQELQNQIRRTVQGSPAKEDWLGWIDYRSAQQIQQQVVEEAATYLSREYDRLKYRLDEPIFLNGIQYQYREKYKKYRRAYVKREEMWADDWAEEEVKRLQKINPKIRLWDGNEDELQLLNAFFLLHHPELNLEDIDDPILREQLRAISDEDKRYPKRY